ncbi:hypothetical protein [Paenibacillus polymyxa]|uniref:Uncharacterized protein n=1 Tax=Paenibacillus polymyxa (strain SC2) TaxID=886882 RepID=E3EJR5_PAEPS|nr:hypothetical protein [Paenibacillus polymyxa]ADO59663.2 hypothetical protein PPSC2_26805 [Paenibacillus polymyxa SC2]WPQ59510.1 metal-dependent phosphohydrolase [Paenibacillus polymyxa]
MSSTVQHISNVVSPEENEFLKDYFGSHYSYIFHNPSGMPEAFYHKEFTWVDIWGLEKEFLDMSRTLELIQQTNQRIEKWKLKNDYLSIFSFMDKKIALQLFTHYVDLIPEPLQYDIFRDVYSKTEYNFHTLTSEFLEELSYLRKHSQKWHNQMKELKTFVDSDGCIAIYRGECTKSSPLNKAWSWTLSYQTALFFATRFSTEGIVYQTRIRYEDVYDYLPNRDEQEVLVDPNKIKNYSKKIVSA